MDAVKVKCFLVFWAVLSDLSEADRPVQTLKQSVAERTAELESFSCWPADVPHPHVLMAFYGSLESLWLLQTSVGFTAKTDGTKEGGTSQYTAEAKPLKDQERRRFWAYLNSKFLIFFFFLVCIGDFIFLDYFYAYIFTMEGLCTKWDFAPTWSCWSY